MKWCYEDCVWFLEQLTLPEHTDDNPAPLRIEGYARLILKTIFRTGLVELLCLLPKGNGKTAIMAGLAVFHLLTVPSPQVFIAAADIEQAKEMFGFAQHYCESEPEILAHVKITESTRVIRLRKGRGRIRVLASDQSKGKGKKHSYSPTLALVDELHAHENTAIYVALRSAMFKGKRPGIPGLETSGIIAIISTAGWSITSVLGELRAGYLECDQTGGSIRRGLVVNGEGNPEQGDGRLNIAVTASGRNVMLEWACRDKHSPDGPPDDLSDMSVVKLANPASFVTEASLEDAREAPGITPWDFSRYRANVWTLAFRSWIPAGSWEALKHPDVQVLPSRTWDGSTDAELEAHVRALYPEDTPVVALLDMARYRDCAAIDCIGRVDGLRVVRSIVWKGSEDNPVPYGPVISVGLWLHEQYDLRAAGCDQKYADQIMTIWEDAGLPVEVWSQANERVCPAAANLRQAILTDKSLAHDGDPILTAHIMAAVAQDVGQHGFKLVKSSASGPPIDAAVALAGANDLDGQDHEVLEPLAGWG